MILVIMIIMYTNNIPTVTTTPFPGTRNLPPQPSFIIQLITCMLHQTALLPHTEMHFCVKSVAIIVHSVFRRERVLKLLEEEIREVENDRHLYPNNVYRDSWSCFLWS